MNSGRGNQRRDGPWIATSPEDADRPANIIDIQALHPEAQRRHVNLYRTLMFGPSPLDRAEREAIAVVVSAANDCFY